MATSCFSNAKPHLLLPRGSGLLNCALRAVKTAHSQADRAHVLMEVIGREQPEGGREGQEVELGGVGLAASVPWRERTDSGDWLPCKQCAASSKNTPALDKACSVPQASSRAFPGVSPLS
jgi:hypothetical protein